MRWEKTKLIRDNIIPYNERHDIFVCPRCGARLDIKEARTEKLITTYVTRCPKCGQVFTFSTNIIPDTIDKPDNEKEFHYMIFAYE